MTYEPVGFLFHNIAMNIWEQLLSKGEHVAAIGGSDDHQAGKEASSGTQTQIGAPTTMVFARELSATAIFEGIRAGRTVVKLQGPEDPMVDFTTDVPRAGARGDTIADEFVVLRAHVTGGGESLRFVKNGTPLPEVPITGNDFTDETLVDAPKDGEDRYRAEILVDGKPRTISSHVFVKFAATGRTRPSSDAGEGGCGCSHPGTRASGAFGLLAVVALAARRRRRV